LAAAEGITIMPLKNGQWDIVAGGFQGYLNIAVDPSGNVTGTIQILNNAPENIAGSWNETLQQLDFFYPTPSVGGERTRFTGYLFIAYKPLFQGPPTPPVTAEWYLIAGDYTTPRFSRQPSITTGWVARISYP
jgi:hypothetical protein